jgi:antitoxin component YwqK of YwqJK toxin-antitoxin module
MIKQVGLFCLIVLINLSAVCQTVGKYKYKNKMYNVYPFRIDNSEDILLVGYKIPDGEYIAFANYNFKEKKGFKRKYVLTDTTIVKGIFTIKNNLAEGSAIFYNYEINSKGKQSHKPSQEIKGAFINGLKSDIWSEGEPEKIPTEFTTYKNGVKDGYHWRSNYSGIVYSKDKFCDGDACDTIFYYRNGKVSTEYDISNTYYSNNNSSCYDKAVDLLNLRQTKVNTYYKQYKNGVLTVDLKFKEGNALPFDSIGIIQGNIRGDYYKYATIKQVNEHQKILTYVSTQKHNARFEQLFYQDDFLYQSKTISYRNIYSKKKVFRKRKIIGVDTLTNENYFLNPNKVIDSSIIPLMIVKYKNQAFNTEKYYIPKYKFIFEKDDQSDNYRSFDDKHYTFNRVDTVTKKIHLNERDYGNYGDYEIKSEYVFIHEDQEELNVFKSQAYRKKSYIISDEMPNCYENYDRHDVSLRNFNTNQYDCFQTKKTYYKNDTALNGTYYFSGVRKSKKWPTNIKHTGYTGLEDNICLGEFTAGKKEGLWKELDYDDYPKRAPLDLKTYFFSHPKKVTAYKEVSYKNGMLEGTYTHYQMYNPKEDDSESKEPIILYKQIEANYTRDTLNGNHKTYYTNGKLKRELNYIMGSPDGECKSYDFEGNLDGIIHFNKGRLDGKYMNYNEGALKSYGNFKNNALCDSLVYYYNNHLINEKVYAKNDTIIKKIKYFNSGKVKEEMNFNNLSTYTMSEELMLSQSFIETLIAGEYNTLRNAQGSFKNYYESGQLLSEGEVKDGALYGPWKFYSINGVMIHEVNFQDTMIVLPNNSDTVEISGYYIGYYTNGKKRCDGYIKDLEVSYDCFSKQDKPDLDFYALNFFDINGKQTLNNGNGYFIKYEANGLRVAAGKLVNCQEDSLWRAYSPEQKLIEIGNFVNNEKDGVWYEGDLEGVNFEDGACFDMNNTEEVNAFNQKRKELSIRKTIYRNGNVIDSQHFESNLNKIYKPKRRRPHSFTPSF